MKPCIFFWHEYENNGFLSNWYKAPFVIDGVEYHSVEQYMMAEKTGKFGDPEACKLIMQSDDPEECKAIGRNASIDIKAWDAVSRDVVYKANRAKFEQHDDLRESLLATGDAILAEANPGDKVWGIALGVKDGTATDPDKWPGANKLGEILMQLRDEFRSADGE